MKKEQLTLENVKKDLGVAIRKEADIVEDWRFLYIIPISLIALIFGIAFQSILIGLAIFSPAAYHIFRFILYLREGKKNKAALLNAVDRGDVSISIKKLSHIAEQTVYEPHITIRRSRTTREVTFFYFEGGAAWRLHNIYKHYDWSRDYAFSPKGLCNVSLSGDEFYYIVLQKAPSVAYVYPCKYFELSPELIKKETTE